MDFVDDKIRVICGLLKDLTAETISEIDNMEYADDNGGEWHKFTREDRLCGADTHFRFRAGFRTPPPCAHKYPVLEFDASPETAWDIVNPQGLLYLNQKAVQGIDGNHLRVRLEYDTDYDMYLYLYKSREGANNVRINLRLVDERIERLYYDLSVPYNAMLCFEKDNYNRILIKRELELAIAKLDLRNIGSKAFFDGVSAATDYMREHFYNGICKKEGAAVSCVGHTHIDVAYLWTIAQTREKVQRSFATVLSLMEKYPEYIFMASQPQLYEYAKETAPELYAKIKERAAEGRWETEGAMWLEADCNLTSGESLVRQIISGKRFMAEEFGADNRILWLPDVFGYSAALPQILRKSGIDKFVTSKISWNETNKMPADSFIWEGIDGSEIFTYFLTGRDCDWGNNQDGLGASYTAYSAKLTPQFLKGTWDRYQQKEYNDDVLITYGYGDGGGGATSDMLEQQRRLAYGIPGLPYTKMSSVGDFLDRAERKFRQNCEKLRRTPKWVGELYLEFHRGTLTSMAKNKRNNRKSEILCQSVETLGVCDMLLLGGGYPANELEKAWKTILLNQFHDIIPGSSIFEVYETSDKQYAQLFDIMQRQREEKLGRIFENIDTDGGVAVYNPTPYCASGAAELDGRYIYAEDIPPHGWRVIGQDTPDECVAVSENRLENEYYTVTFSPSGAISSIFDKEYNREVVAHGRLANELQVFEDFPKKYDAWEISSYYKDKMWTIDDVQSIEPLDEGERAGIKITKLFQNSRIEQRIYLYAHSRRIDFVTDCDWHEKHVLLKAAFPFNVHTNKASYEIQFGNLERPTHSNTSWDEAKFEVCAHRWADMSEEGYGVSLLNDCKYGHSAEGSTMKLSLIKCAEYPNKHADRGHHSFTYALLPHGGDFREGATVREAYLLNNPLTASVIGKQAGSLPQCFSLISCGSKNIAVDTVKKAESSDAVIVRFYECFNRSGRVKLDTGFDFREAYVCDLLENVISEAEHSERSVFVNVGCYEIVTLKFVV